MITYSREQCGYLVVDQESGADMFVQTDYDFPGLATTFGWSIASVHAC